MTQPPHTTDPSVHGEKRRHPWRRAMWWVLAPLDSRKQGLSLTRLLSGGMFVATCDIAHDWLSELRKVNGSPGWAFVAFVVTGFTLSVLTALGAKYIDKLLDSIVTIMVAKFTGATQPKAAAI